MKLLHDSPAGPALVSFAVACKEAGPAAAAAPFPRRSSDSSHSRPCRSQGALQCNGEAAVGVSREKPPRPAQTRQPRRGCGRLVEVRAVAVFIAGGGNRSRVGLCLVEPGFAGIEEGAGLLIVVSKVRLLSKESPPYPHPSRGRCLRPRLVRASGATCGWVAAIILPNRERCLSAERQGSVFKMGPVCRSCR